MNQEESNNQEQSDLENKYKQILNSIFEYNTAAIKENSNVRLGLACSEAYRDFDEEEGDEQLSHEEFIKRNSYYENAGVSIRTAGTYSGWFPSSICY